MERILATYGLETALELEPAIAALASEGSTGTFVAVPGETQAVRDRFGIRLEGVERLPDGERPHLLGARGAVPGNNPIKRARVTLSVPLELTGTDLTAIGASLLGNVYELAELSGIRLEQLDFPEALLRAAPLPRHGVAGSRRLLGVEGRPLFGTIVRTAAGPAETAAAVTRLLDAGLEFIKDDEVLADSPGNRLEARIEAVTEALDRHAERSGRRAMFAFNITDELEPMLRHQEAVAKAGGSCVQVNVQHVGPTAVATLRRRTDLLIHGHRAGWGMVARGPGAGISAAAHASLWRLAGLDQLIVNGFDGKFWEPAESVLGAVDACLTPYLGEGDRTLPVIAAGQTGKQIPETFARTGSRDWLYLAGAAVADHPEGLAAGLRVLQRAWEAAQAGEGQR